MEFQLLRVNNQRQFVAGEYTAYGDDGAAEIVYRVKGGSQGDEKCYKHHDASDVKEWRQIGLDEPRIGSGYTRYSGSHRA